VQKWLWELRRAVVTLNDKVKKLQSSRFTTAEKKVKLLRRLYVDMHDSWTELVCENSAENIIV
jgi:hypothetical protein